MKSEKIKIQCDQCGKDFYQYPYLVKRVKKHFCSKECYSQFLTKRIKVKCAQCNKDLLRRNLTQNYQKYFCSKKCRKEYYGDHGRYKGKCDQCGKDMDIFLYKKNRKNHFCSRECFNKYRIKRVIVKCKECQKPFSLHPFLVKKNKNHFCSKKCQNNYISHNYKEGKSSRWKGGICDRQKMKEIAKKRETTTKEVKQMYRDLYEGKISGILQEGI